VTAGERAGLDVGRSALRVTQSSAFRFLVVGAVSVTVDAGLLYILHGRLGMWLPPATALSFLAGFIVNFALNRQWSFGATGTLHRQLVRYLALVGGNLLVTVALVQAITWLGVSYLIAKILTTAALSAVNYVISRKYIFV
jgi:putative flippase GtrA